MPVFDDIQLRDKHTFHIDAKTRFWADFESVEELRNILKDSRFTNCPILAVGGGSNLLFTQDYPGLLVHSALKSIEATPQEDGNVLIRSGSGVAWDDLVAFSVRMGWSGLENLSGIPGDVGASPIQNIGAYGSEAKDSIVLVEALDLKSLEMKTFTNADCAFGYRNSIFKKDLINQFIVCYVTYRLSETFHPNIRYGDLSRRLEEAGGATLENLRETVLSIRSEKLPDPNVQGNAGSFFMNPELPETHYRMLQAKWPEIPAWPQENERVKISAAWCIDKAGWKGKSLGNAAVHDKQALVIVNLGKAVAVDVLNLSQQIVNDVEKMFGVRLQTEVLFV
jgi:UDP-N-acetylmuramate dehydrogenase